MNTAKRLLLIMDHDDGVGGPGGESAEVVMHEEEWELHEEETGTHDGEA